MGNDTTAAPIVVTPSQYFEGNDGPWSTFNIHAGTPPQPARVLVGTALGESWVVSANKTGWGGCPGTDTPAEQRACAQARGALFNLNASSTWQDQGIFGLAQEQNLPDYTASYDAGDYGLETMGLGLPGSNDTDEPNMVVAAFATTDYYFGYLGVTSHPTNFTQFNDPHPTYLSALKQSGKIPSLSYGYTAGAPYRFKKVYGSLTLGGYDASRFTPNDVDFQFASDISRDIVVGLQSISYTDSMKSTSQPLSSEGHLTFIDATVPQIWLPQDACTLFEDAFGLTYNDTINRYLVNSTLREQLQSRNPSISFIIGNDINGGPNVNITLPYQAFDLILDKPIVNSTQYYFPLRRADNDTQTTLGRTFLQEAYLITNYEHSNFSVSQNIWVEDAKSEILAIRAANSTNPTQKSGISTGAIVGIIVAVVVLLLLAAAGAAVFIIRKRHRRKELAETKKEEEESFRKAEMDGTGRPPIGELYSEDKLGEADSSSKIEMQGSHPDIAAYDKNKAEMEGSRGGVEMEGTKGGVEMEGSRLRAEMDGDYLSPVEMYAGSQGLYELPSPATSNSELPSPLNSGNERRSGTARWSRKLKPVPKLPDSESSDFSPDGETPGRGSGADMWSVRRPPRSLTPKDVSSPSSDSRERRPSGSSANFISSPSSTSHHSRPSVPSQRGSQLEVPSRTTTPSNVPSSTSNGRERQRNAGNALDRRMQNRSPLDLSSTSDSSGGGDRFGSRERVAPSRSENTSPFDSPSDGSMEMFDRRRPSPLSSGGTPRPSPPAEATPRGQSPKPPANFF